MYLYLHENTLGSIHIINVNYQKIYFLLKNIKQEVILKQR